MKSVINSPQRFFLDAPKQEPGTCFVLNCDYQALEAHCRILERALEAARRWLYKGIEEHLESKSRPSLDEGWSPEYLNDLAAMRAAER